MSRKFHEFREQTKKHETILMNAIRAFGMNPDYMSPAAKLAEQKAAALLNTRTNPNGLPSAAVQLNVLEKHYSS